MRQTLKQRIVFGRVFPLVVLLVLFSHTIGCKVGPNYLQQQMRSKADWSQSTHPRFNGEPAELGTWWNHFQDPALDHLMNIAREENLTLRQVGQRIVEARARRGIAAGNLLPQSQTANGSFSKSRLSSTTANFFSFPGVFEPDLNPENWSVGLSAAWELDFWGRYRRAIETADASLDATIAAYDDAAVLLFAEVASSYVEMRAYEQRIGFAYKNLGIQKRTFELAERKRLAELGTAIDTAQAESNYAQTAAVTPSLEIARRQVCHRLSILLGRSPSDEIAELGYTAVVPHPPSQIGFGIPADLLRRRPDVRKAERELAAQSARIGVAESEFYPHISLVGNIGYTTEDFGKLTRSKSSNGIISPNFSWNILNYGRIKKNVEAEKAVFNGLAFSYQSAVLNAEREAEDAQVAFVLGFDRIAALQVAISKSSEAVERLLQAYEAGVSDYSRIYLLQADLLRQQDQLAQTEGQVSISLISLFKALGGGWEFARNSYCEPNAHMASLK